MSKTSRFRHRREKSEQGKVRTAVNPAAVTRSYEAEEPQAEPLISPLTPFDAVESPIFNESVAMDKPKAPDLVLVKLSQGMRDELHTWKNASGTMLTSGRSTVPAIKKQENQKRLRKSSSRKDVR